MRMKLVIRIRHETLLISYFILQLISTQVFPFIKLNNENSDQTQTPSLVDVYFLYGHYIPGIGANR